MAPCPGASPWPLGAGPPELAPHWVLAETLSQLLPWTDTGSKPSVAPEAQGWCVEGPGLDVNAGLRVLRSGPGPGPATETTHLLSTYTALGGAFCHFQLRVLSANRKTLHPGGEHRHPGSPAPPTRHLRSPAGTSRALEAEHPRSPRPRSRREAAACRCPGACCLHVPMPRPSSRHRTLPPSFPGTQTSAMRAPNPAGDSPLWGRAWLQAIWEVGRLT